MARPPVEKTFVLSEIAKACGADLKRVKQWFHRMELEELLSGVSGREIEVSGRGGARRFDLSAVVFLVIFIELAKNELPLSVAKKAALAFSALGTSAADYGDGPNSVPRLPGRLFPEGRTMIVIAPNALDPVQVVNVTEKTPLGKFLDEVGGAGFADFLDVRTVLRLRLSALGLTLEEIFTETS